MRKLFIRDDFDHLATLVWNNGTMSTQDVHQSFEGRTKAWVQTGTTLDQIANELKAEAKYKSHLTEF